MSIALNGGLAEVGGIQLTFPNVTSAGGTTVCVTTPCPPDLTPDSGFRIFGLGGQSTCDDINTAASFTGPVEVCIRYDDTSVTLLENTFTLRRRNPVPRGPEWTDITTSLDTAGNIICGDTDTFSIFTVQAPAPVGGPPAVGGIVELRANADAPAPEPQSSSAHAAPAAGLCCPSCRGGCGRTHVSRLVRQEALVVVGPRLCAWAGQVSTGLACYAEAEVKSHCGTHKGDGPEEG